MSHSGDSGDNAIVEHILTAKGRVAVPNRMKGRGGSFSIQKFIKGFSRAFSEENCNIIFRK